MKRRSLGLRIVALVVGVVWVLLINGCKDPACERRVEAEVSMVEEVTPAVGCDISSVAEPTLRVIPYPSANYDVRCLPVSMIVLHYTAVTPVKKALAHLCNTRNTGRVSAHYLVDEDGTIYQLVDESRRAWHAGLSYWKGIRDVNSASIGIEIVHAGPNHKGQLEPYPDCQIDAVIRLCQDIMQRHTIRYVLGHSDVAPRRKVDPGENFPWMRLAAEGVGVWTDEILETNQPPLKLLAQLGYDTTDGYAAIQAFRRHWHPEGLDGRNFRATVGRMAALLKY